MQVVKTLEVQAEWCYNKYDFLTGTAPYEELYAIEDELTRQQAKLRMKEYAKTVGVGAADFERLNRAFQQSVRQYSQPEVIGRITSFPGQPLQLCCGKWQGDGTGIWRENGNGAKVYACPHPILPVERLTDLDTGEESLTLAFQRGVSGGWRLLTVPRSTLASASRVTKLADAGISVTSETAKDFIQYIFDVEALNYETLPHRSSIGRLGYIPGVGFAPYVDGLVLDGAAASSPLLRSVASHGSFDGGDEAENWLYAARWARHTTPAARIMLAASFASPLLSIVGALPFFVHLWSSSSGTGKTVALMLAASVWGDPALGAYIQTFDSTAVGQERSAALLNHLPLCLDEFQLARGHQGRAGSFNPYLLAEGVGRTRGNKYGGVDRTTTWRNAILTTGESPLTGTASGSGAVNRVLELECTEASPAVPPGCGPWLSGLLQRHYGHAGRRFALRLCETDPEEIRQLYTGFHSRLLEMSPGTTEKQVMAAAAVLTGDTLACDWIFSGEEQPMQPDELLPYLAEKQTVSNGQRAYDFLVDWVAMNKVRFQIDSNVFGEVWGSLTPFTVSIISSKFNAALTEQGFDPQAVLSWLWENGKLASISVQKGRKRNTTKVMRICGVVTRCVCLKLPEADANA